MTIKSSCGYYYGRHPLCALGQWSAVVESSLSRDAPVCPPWCPGCRCLTPGPGSRPGLTLLSPSGPSSEHQPGVTTSGVRR